VGRSVLWDALRVGRFKSWTFSDGTFLEWDVSRAGPFVCAPSVEPAASTFKVQTVEAAE
jgi:hypothetical protein